MPNKPDTESRLEERKVRLRTGRLSMRLEPEFWDALHTIAEATGVTIDDVCQQAVEAFPSTMLGSAVRVFILNWCRK